jgi:glycosyltransferase domain-containing protein
MTPRLTVLLPLKGRQLFTLRFLWHANKARLPYRFLLADGGVNEAFARHLENDKETWPQLDLEYIRYPDDADYKRYFAKVNDALQRVRTPYVMLADNDDFLGFDGIESSIDFLEANADYACARGRIAAFAIYSGLKNPGGGIQGRLNGLRFSYDTASIDAPRATDRLRQGALVPGQFYAIYRTAALTAIWQEVVEIGFSDLMLHESFCALRAVTCGKVHINKAVISYFRQLGSSLSYQASLDWTHHLLRSRFTADAHEAVKHISVAAAAADGTDGLASAEDVRTILEQYFREFLLIHYGLSARLKNILRLKLPNLVKYLQNRRRLLTGRERTALVHKLTVAGAAHDYLKRFRKEIALIEAALSPQAFAEYACRFLPMASANDSRDWL